MGGIENSNPAEVCEQYLGRLIADPFTRLLLEYAAPKHGERVLDLASGTGSIDSAHISQPRRMMGSLLLRTLSISSSRCSRRRLPIRTETFS
jgi:hypothetical protein